MSFISEVKVNPWQTIRTKGMYVELRANLERIEHHVDIVYPLFPEIIA